MEKFEKSLFDDYAKKRCDELIKNAMAHIYGKASIEPI